MRILSFHAVAGLLIVGVGVASYANSINVPFVFDDSQNVAHNEHIRLSDWSWKSLYDAAYRSPSYSRPVANLSFAFNYYWGGDDPLIGIHVVNILIHVLNGLLVYFLCLSWLSFAGFAWQPGSFASQPDNGWGQPELRRRAVALVTALLFTAHPMQSQAVTYVVQRMVSLSVMFYLLALVLYFSGRLKRDALSRYCCWGGTCIAWGLGIGCKQIAYTLPLVIALSEWLLLSTSPQVPRLDYRRLGWRLAGGVGVVSVAFALLCITIWWNPIAELTSHFSRREFTTAERLWTQSRIVVFYLSLLFYPHPARLNLLHDIFPPVSALAPLATVASILLLGSMLGWGIYFIRRQPLLAFCIFWFFIQLLIESTVIPLEMVFEHRAYLPSIGAILFLVALVDSIGGRWRTGVYASWVVVLCLLAASTIARNRVWQDAISLWSDVITKSPFEPRGWNNRGKEYVDLGLSDGERRDEYFEKAQRDYETAMGRSRNFVEVYNNLGNLFVELGQRQQAIDYLTRSIQLRGNLPVFRYNRAVAYEQFGELDLAIRDYDDAIKWGEDFVAAYFNRGVVYGKMGQPQRAIEDFGRVLALNPRYAAAFMNRGDAYMQIDQLELALRDFNDVIRIEPEMAQAYYNRAGAHQRLEKSQLALRDYDFAIEIAPELDLAYYNRANIYMNAQQYERAIEDFTIAIERNPGHTAAYNNRGLSYMSLGDFPQALADFDRAIEIGSSSTSHRKRKQQLPQGSAERSQRTC